MSKVTCSKITNSYSFFFLTDTKSKKGILAESSFQKCLTFTEEEKKEQVKGRAQGYTIIRWERETDFTDLSYQKTELYLTIKSCGTLSHGTISQSLGFLTS